MNTIIDKIIYFLWYSLFFILSVIVFIWGIQGLNNISDRVKDAELSVEVDTYTKYMTMVDKGVSCHGVFMLTTDQPVTNAEYNIPNSISGDVYRTTDHVILWSEQAPYSYVDGIRVDTANFLSQFVIYNTKYNILEKNTISSYLPINWKYTFVYISSEGKCYLNYNTTLPVAEAVVNKSEAIPYLVEVSIGAIVMVSLMGVFCLKMSKRGEYLYEENLN